MRTEAAGKDTAISLIRAIAMAMIITCHILQYLDMELAWWFNVGVQIFLCISGYLYGSRREQPCFTFVGKQFCKILLDYWVVIVPAMVLYMVFNVVDTFTVGEMAGYIVGYDTLPGGGHLWYVSIILFCYLLTPLMQSFFDYCEKRSPIGRWMHYLAAFLVVQTACYYFFPYFNGAWINCYLFGFLLRRVSSLRNQAKALNVCIFVLAIALNSVQIAVDYINPGAIEILPDVFISHYGLLCNYAHVSLGVSSFICMHNFFSKIGYCDGALRVLGLSDKYSYDVYLVHQFYILGPASLMEATPCFLVNVLLIIAATFVTAFAVNIVSSRVRKLVTWFSTKHLGATNQLKSNSK